MYVFVCLLQEDIRINVPIKRRQGMKCWFSFRGSMNHWRTFGLLFRVQTPQMNTAKVNGKPTKSKTPKCIFGYVPGIKPCARILFEHFIRLIYCQRPAEDCIQHPRSTRKFPGDVRSPARPHAHELHSAKAILHLLRTKLARSVTTHT